MKILFLSPLFAIVFAVVFSPSLSAETLHPQADLKEERPRYQTLTFPTGHSLRAEIADTPSRREKGLMFRERLPENEGMLFVFPQAMPYRFWMKNCRFPIDIVWMSDQKEIVHIAENVPPCKGDPCPTYGPEAVASRYVLEVGAGGARRENLKVGQRMKF